METPLSQQSTFRRLQALHRDPRWSFLDALPFIDMINLCSSAPQFIPFCSDREYLQRRLIQRADPIDRQALAFRYQSLVDFFNSPIDAYVKALVDADAISSDSTILIYVQKTDILFFGLEYLIGLAHAGVRAVNQNRPDFLDYILSMLPTTYEMTEIVGALFTKYMEQKLLNQETIVTEDKLDELLDETETGLLAIVDKFYPRTEEQYFSYKAGLAGLPRPFDLSESQPSPELEEGVIIPYLLGLIDGHHDQLFIQTYLDLDPSSYKPIIDDYVSTNGTVEMMSFIIRSIDRNFSSLKDHLDLTVYANNVPVVEYLLDIIPQDENVTVSALIPRSKEMLNLFHRYRIKPTPDEIMLGAMLAGNYDLLEESGIVKLPAGLMDKFINNSDEIPGYMISLYFRKYHTESLFLQLMRRLIDLNDYYRENVVLSLGLTFGYKPNDLIRSDLVGQANDRNLVRLGLLDIYPNFRNYVV